MGKAARLTNQYNLKGWICSHLLTCRVRGECLHRFQASAPQEEVWIPSLSSEIAHLWLVVFSTPRHYTEYNKQSTPIHWHFTCCGLLMSVAASWKSVLALGSGAMQSPFEALMAPQCMLVTGRCCTKFMQVVQHFSRTGRIFSGHILLTILISECAQVSCVSWHHVRVHLSTELTACPSSLEFLCAQQSWLSKTEYFIDLEIWKHSYYNRVQHTKARVSI